MNFGREVHRGIRVAIWMIPFTLGIIALELFGGFAALNSPNGWFLMLALLVSSVMLTFYGLGWAARKTGGGNGH